MKYLKPTPLQLAARKLNRAYNHGLAAQIRLRAAEAEAAAGGGDAAWLKTCQEEHRSAIVAKNNARAAYREEQSKSTVTRRRPSLPQPAAGIAEFTAARCAEVPVMIASAAARSAVEESIAAAASPPPLHPVPVNRHAPQAVPMSGLLTPVKK